MKNSKWSTDSEAMMMGFVIPIENEEHLEFVIEYVRKTLTDAKIPFGDDFIEKSKMYAGDYTYIYRHLSIQNTRIGLLLAVTIETPNVDEEPYDLLSEFGTFSYVFNCDVPSFSELGYTFYRNENGRVRRIG